jgi:hypothetical protein
MTTLEVMTLEVLMRGKDTNFFHVVPLRGFNIYILPRTADTDFDSICIDDKLDCLVDTTHMLVLSVCRDKRK